MRLTLVLAFALLPLLASRVSDLRAGGGRNFRIEDVPAQVGGFTFRGEQPLSGEVLSMLVPEWYTMRVYADDAGHAVWLYVALYAGSETIGAHDPEVCYPAQGWRATDAVEQKITLASTEAPVVKVLSAALGGREDSVLYWFQPARRWSASAAPERMLRILDRLQGRPEYAFVRLSTELDSPTDAGRRAAQERLTRFASELAPWIRNAVTNVSR
jgi:EpsI family protein